MTIYIPFKEQDATQLKALANHLGDTDIRYREVRSLANVRGPLRICAHGSRDGYLFHDSNVRRASRLMVLANELSTQLKVRRWGGVGIELHCCELKNTDFPPRFSKEMGRRVVVTAYPYSLQNPRQFGGRSVGGRRVEVTVQKESMRKNPEFMRKNPEERKKFAHRHAAVFESSSVSGRFCDGKKVPR